MKAILAWILVAILGLGALFGHQQQADFRERQQAGESYLLGCRDSHFPSDLICQGSKERAAKVADQRTLFYFYLPLACAGIAFVFALFLSLKSEAPQQAAS